MSQLISNLNVGVVGHVDSGKTTLAKALSTVGSTAAFDKHPQSQERGITLDLGFSSFSINDAGSDADRRIQYTLVDCPGHASLLRTVIGGASIIDLFVLVVDVLAGIQTQTAECIVVADIARPGKMIVVLNKTDLLPEADRSSKIEKMKKRVSKVLEPTSFKEAPIVAVSALQGTDLDALRTVLANATYLPSRSPEGPFVLSADHCFLLKGQGTVLTGTVLSGSVAVGQTVEIAHGRETRKVKTMQMFKRPVQQAQQGDRIGMCVSQLDASGLERCLVCSPGALLTLTGGIFEFNRISYHKAALKNKAKFHVTIGHEMSMGKCTFFAVKRGLQTLQDLTMIAENSDFEYFDTVPDRCEGCDVMVFIKFATPVLCMPDALMIAARLDTDVNAKACRLAFHGRLAVPLEAKQAPADVLSKLRIFKRKERSGAVERQHDEATLIVVGLFKKETNLDLFANMKVELSTGEKGIIEGGFGSSGKVRVRVLDDFTPEAQNVLDALAASRKKKKDVDVVLTSAKELRVMLRFRKYLFADKNVMVQ